MELQEKLTVLAEIFGCDAATLTPDAPLEALGWDSMAMLSVMAVVRARFGRNLPGAEVRALTTVKDILDRMAAP